MDPKGGAYLAALFPLRPRLGHRLRLGEHGAPERIELVLHLGALFALELCLALREQRKVEPLHEHRMLRVATQESTLRFDLMLAHKGEVISYLVGVGTGFCFATLKVRKNLLNLASAGITPSTHVLVLAAVALAAHRRAVLVIMAGGLLLRPRAELCDGFLHLALVPRFLLPEGQL